MRLFQLWWSQLLQELKKFRRIILTVIKARAIMKLSLIWKVVELRVKT